MSAPNAIASEKLLRLIGTARVPVILDVRSDEDFAADPRLLPGATAITAAVVGVILNLAVWFGLHVLFGELRPVAAMGLDLDLPVWSTLDVAALVLVVAAVIAVFRFRLGAVTVLAGCAVAGLVLRLAGLA